MVHAILGGGRSIFASAAIQFRELNSCKVPGIMKLPRAHFVHFDIRSRLLLYVSRKYRIIYREDGTTVDRKNYFRGAVRQLFTTFDGSVAAIVSENALEWNQTHICFSNMKDFRIAEHSSRKKHSNDPIPLLNRYSGDAAVFKKRHSASEFLVESSFLLDDAQHEPELAIFESSRKDHPYLIHVHKMRFVVAIESANTNTIQIFERKDTSRCEKIFTTVVDRTLNGANGCLQYLVYRSGDALFYLNLETLKETQGPRLSYLSARDHAFTSAVTAEGVHIMHHTRRTKYQIFRIINMHTGKVVREWSIMRHMSVRGISVYKDTMVIQTLEKNYICNGIYSQHKK